MVTSKKVGGIRFFKIGRWNISISRSKRLAKVEDFCWSSHFDKLDKIERAKVRWAEDVYLAERQAYLLLA